jgi:hypothetical protein
VKLAFSACCVLGVRCRFYVNTIFLPLNNDGSTDHVSSRNKVEQLVLLFARRHEDWWLGQEDFELRQGLISLCGTHELLLVLE